MRSRAAVLAVLAAALALPQAASADSFDSLYRDFKDDGAISSCRWSDRELRSAERDIPADVEQYAPGFADQIAVARQRHARGECDRSTAAAPAVAGVPAPPPAEIPADTGVDVPAALALLGWLVIVAAAVTLVVLAVSRIGGRPDQRGLRASIREAGERLGDLAREFWDWLRLGR